MAPPIKHIANKAPMPVVRGHRIKMEAISSKIPVKILPHGSMPSEEKIYTDSSAPVNLKYKVWSIMTAAKILSTHNRMVNGFNGMLEH